MFQILRALITKAGLASRWRGGDCGVASCQGAQATLRKVNRCDATGQAKKKSGYVMDEEFFTFAALK